MSLKDAYLAEQRNYEYMVLGVVLGVVVSLFAVCSLRPPERPHLKYEETWRCIEAQGGASWSAKELEEMCGVNIAGGRLRMPRQ